VKGDGERKGVANKNRPGEGAALIEFEQLGLNRFSLF
jgi:hypothetical protein